MGPKKLPKVQNSQRIPFSKSASPIPAVLPPSRLHSTQYHWPLLLEDRSSCDALLEWFEGVEQLREMPWRKQWIDPDEIDHNEVDAIMAKRAYEVWVSEIMLQQTRVSTVIPYFTNWVSKWPTVEDLSKADHDDVLAAWKGLGYYSRATRLHQAAQEMMSKNPVCPVPSQVEDLLELPGIGRYTAGAISSIAFGEAEPVLDGNVIRVLSRQLGLCIDPKDKKSTDLLWNVADSLVKFVSGYPASRNSSIPGQWNQALMELGSTVCTPQPKCGDCPVRSTCRAFAEGEILIKRSNPSPSLPDIEDSCSYCELLDTEDLVMIPEETNNEESGRESKKRKGVAKQGNTISHYFTASQASPSSELSVRVKVKSAETTDRNKRKASDVDVASKPITMYCSLFPKKVAKKKPTEEECVVCLIEAQGKDGSSKWMIEQRPDKGLLASLWQFPQCPLPPKNQSTSDRKSSAKSFVSAMKFGHIDMSKAKYKTELESLVHIFTHIRLTMHVHHFKLELDAPKDLDCINAGPPKRKWVDTDAMDHETLSTGMRRCWSLVNDTAARK
ncbi:DNA glycosylase [Dendryphion nanum]|uniref:Adenine DNA glycosylase n=1 Tax=Dendryphion nanum TaxID=256645 RepID=A0A9P9E0E7_9PLEO|nr:DNA glycosylase [Dendryphion nanum]